MTAKKILKTIFLLLIIVSVCGYIGYQARNILRGPSITILSPADNSTTLELAIELRGSVKNTSKITINDRPILVSTDGTFSEILALLDGYNIITLKAADRFGREITETRKLIRQTPHDEPRAARKTEERIIEGASGDANSETDVLTEIRESTRTNEADQSNE